MKTYNKQTRVKGESASDAIRALEASTTGNYLGFGGFTIGKELFGKSSKFSNNTHKGFELLSFGVVIGITDSGENLDALELLLNPKETFGSKHCQRFIGGVEIFDNAKHLFDCELPALEAGTVAPTLSAEDKKVALKGARKRKKRINYNPVRVV